MLLYLNENSVKKLYNNLDYFELQENIFNLDNYTKKGKAELDEAINELSKIVEEKYQKLEKELRKKYKKFYETIGLEPLYIVYNCKEQRSLIELFAYLLSKKINEKVTSKDIVKIIKYSAPFQITIDLKLTDENKKKISGKVVFIIVPENTIFNRLIRVSVYRHITNSILNHPKWSTIEELIFLIHELIEAEEDNLEGRGNHPSGKIFVDFKGKNYAISNHHSIIVLAKEAVILNKYKHIKALKKLREARYLEWKAIKALTGVDLSILTHLDNKTIKKLLKIKLSDVKLKNEKGEEEVVKHPKINYEDALKTPISKFKFIIKNIFKNNFSFPKIKDIKNLIKN
jgi:hypothetical protein